MNSERYPILKMLIPYIFGILFAYFGNFPKQNSYLFISIIIVLMIISAILFAKLSYKLHWLPSVFLLAASFFLGFFLTNFHLSPHFDKTTEEYITNNRLWDATIISAPVRKEKSVKVTVQLHNSLEKRKNDEKVILYIRTDSKSIGLRHGDRILVNTHLERVSPPQNPYAFDNRHFLQRRGIYFTGFVESNGWVKTDSTFSLRRAAARLQSIFARQFARTGLEGDEYAVITAILLGDDDTMHPTLKASYATAGVSHILCVSGMHVGIIFMILDFLLKPLTLNRTTNIIKTILLLLFIWFYAHITGLTPSVMRAAAMFTFVAFGSLLRRNTDIYHSLFASLSVMLLANPLLLFEVGLQLSYAAVFGIVTFQPILSKIWCSKTKIGNYFWSLATVSVAAQIATFPISVHYFGQFPNYFLISNLSVICLSFIVVISGIITLCVSFIPKISLISGTILSYEIKAMNGIIHKIDALPYSLTDNIFWSKWQVVALYLLIIFLYLFLTRKQKKYLNLAFAMLAVFAIIRDIHLIKNLNTIELTFYSVAKRSCIGLNQNGSGVIFSDSLFSRTAKEYDYVIRNHEIRCGIRNKIARIDKNHKGKNLTKKGNFIFFCGKKIYILNHSQKIYDSGATIATDYLLLSGNPKEAPENVAKVIEFGIVIADGSNGEQCKRKWEEWCIKNHITYHDTKKSGFLNIKAN